MHEYLDRRYALALYKIGEEKGKVKEYLEELRQVVAAIKGNSKFLEIMEHPEVSTSEKKKMFTEIFKDKVNEDILSFLLVLIEKDRINEIDGKLREMENIYLESNNTVKAKVKTVIALNDDERNTLIEKLEKKFNKKVLIEEEIDPSIIGGVYVEVNNEVIDGSIRSKLSEMKKIMLKGEQR
ncbi:MULTISPECIES: F0F1 ATP synthase subunit delta [Clostridium]|jgi:F-type H+-transporting ATPase subunit delta|uniref:ATP synthase subunit delta n=4 Tax=Clostridium TaxID=1485 RepID=D8GKZ7_CLOLD|nr:MULTISPECIES: F0F1 ATP synthase subunit delta [Clostridium]ADK13330.1 F1Fo ATPase, subunit delta [Clostridium ljungdahlii DSM 13528]AGY76557.1 F0F1 ATP synthase subunit delta [Clostridium autoethanogenum DSM 10061]ALU36716.1 ATP synthase subunit delta [Clostridium autoethanogenum DSM 10061]OAA88949.1 ATP synthase subunit delta, sodium ion specific [Clostridium ljungdahlii DSM 13528]OBR91822.1 ATP synthase subunit delta, sodium ion specific [Clostridium ragsdalei P11]